MAIDAACALHAQHRRSSSPATSGPPTAQEVSITDTPFHTAMVAEMLRTNHDFTATEMFDWLNSEPGIAKMTKHLMTPPPPPPRQQPDRDLVLHSPFHLALADWAVEEYGCTLSQAHDFPNSAAGQEWVKTCLQRTKADVDTISTKDKAINVVRPLVASPFIQQRRCANVSSSSFASYMFSTHPRLMTCTLRAHRFVPPTSSFVMRMMAFSASWAW